MRPPGSAVTAAITPWLRRQRWFPADPDQIRHLASIPLPPPPEVADAPAIVRSDILAVHLSAQVVVVHVPVVLEPAEPAEPAAAPLIGTVSGWRIYDGPTHPAFLPAWLAAADSARALAPTDPRRIHLLTGEQSNTSVVAPGNPGIITKVLRVLGPGPNPDVEIPAALADTGHVPQLLGAIEGQWPDPTTGEQQWGHLGVISEYIPAAEDGFDWVLTQARAGTSIEPAMQLLGRTLAHLHAALREHLPHPSPMGSDELAGHLHERAQWACDQLAELRDRSAQIHATVGRLSGGADLPAAQRIHGDLHLGQVLRTASGWVLLDFEGEPLRPITQRRRPDQAVRDVAGLLRSLDYADELSAVPDPRWLDRARAGVLEGYLDAADPTDSQPGTRRLIAAFEFDKALYEAVYEAQHRPDWASIPLQAIDRFLQEDAMAPTAQPISADVLDALADGRHPAPHDVLGAHLDGDVLTVRTIAQLAESVTIITPDQRIRASHEHRGIWVAAAHATQLTDYRLDVTYPSHQAHDRDDPYRHGPLIGEMDLHLIGEGRHEQLWQVLGAHLRSVTSELGTVTGTSFTVWAPNARAVRVIGDFNGWDGSSTAMRRLGDSGIWEIFLPDVGAGALYKYEICHPDGSWHAKADPMARRTEVPPATASIVTESDYLWSAGDAQWMDERSGRDPHTGPMSVYEVHLGSWRQGLSYRELASELVEYVRWMGFTHVELLPVAEHPYGPSWGYQVTSYYAPTARFGSPDEFRYLVDALHSAGIGVFLDWVPAHFPRDSWALAQFDGTYLYEHPDPWRGEHQDWGTLIFNFGRHEVRNFLVANALYWLREFHIDGLRVDAVASMLYLDYSRSPGQWQPNIRGGRENLEAIQFLQETTATAYRLHPGIVMAAEESTAWPGVTSATSQSGLGFGLKWNMGWMNDTLRYLAEDPINRRYHHGELTFSIVYAFSEQYLLPLSHDEVVHGKGSLLTKLPGDRWQQLAGLRTLFTYQWTHPGKKLLFMGGEFGQESEWAESRSLDWDLGRSPDHAALRLLLRDLNHFYREHPALWAEDFNTAGFQWLEAGAGDDNLIAYLRRTGAEQVAVIINFSGTPHEDYRIPLPQGGQWREAINTDATIYGGSGVGNLGAVRAQPRPQNGRSHSALMRIPPMGALILVPESDPHEPATDIDERSVTQKRAAASSRRA